MKHCIPLHRFETITIDMVDCNLETDWYDFKIKFEGVCSTEVHLNSVAIEKIHEAVRDMIKKVNKHNNKKESK